MFDHLSSALEWLDKMQEHADHNRAVRGKVYTVLGEYDKQMPCLYAEGRFGKVLVKELSRLSVWKRYRVSPYSVYTKLDEEVEVNEARCVGETSLAAYRQLKKFDGFHLCLNRIGLEVVSFNVE